MKRDISFFFLSVLFLTFFPGCRIIDWGKQNVDQGTNVETNITVAKENIRSSRIYDQFTLVGAFDSLWLADDIRELIADIYALKRGKSDEEKQIFLRRQLEENNHFISFYVLSPADILIGDKDSEWTILLKIGSHFFIPTEFKKVELSPEYKFIFGKKHTRFKTAYILRFNAKDIEDQPLINTKTDEIKLVFKTTKKEAFQAWHVKQKEKPAKESV